MGIIRLAFFIEVSPLFREGLGAFSGGVGLLEAAEFDRGFSGIPPLGRPSDFFLVELALELVIDGEVPVLLPVVLAGGMLAVANAGVDALDPLGGHDDSRGDSSNLLVGPQGSFEREAGRLDNAFVQPLSNHLVEIKGTSGKLFPSEQL